MNQNRNLEWIYIGRALRSFITAFLTVIFPLYLAKEGYSASRIGLVLALSGAMTVALVAAVGLFADFYGRRRAIIGLAILGAVGGTAMGLSHAFWWAVVASGLGGVGRGGGAGSGGSWGPVFPAEQPLVTDSVAPERRTWAFGRISFIGVLAGAAGSLVAGVPAWLHHQGWTLLAGYRLLFFVGALLSLAMVFASLPIREHLPNASARDEAPPPIPLRTLMGRLGLTNALNGLGFGFLGPLLTYWFYRRFGVGSAEIGLLYTFINLAAAFPYLWSSHLAKRLGAVKTVTVTRGLGLLMMLLMVFMPSFTWAGLFYLLRMVFNSLGMPARQSFVMGVSESRYRSRVSAFSSLPSQLTAMITPAVGGALMQSVLDIPIYGAVFFMGLNLITYWWSFHNVPEGQTIKAGGPSS
ncbi:MAG: MFS transporter [Firmicutes bacterium]|nr:MFS transporter [Bacillota bacterium]